MNTADRFEAIYKAKADGMSDEDIMKEFNVGLREIERAVIRREGVNLNVFSTSPGLNNLQPKNFKLEPSTVWSFKSRGKWATHNGNYRGNWSPYIPRNIILRYSRPGDIVLDQFCGGGTTAVEAKLLGRRCVARDINPSAVEFTRRNLAFDIRYQKALDGSDSPVDYHEPTLSVGDARDLSDIADGSIDLICTHPPYADIVHYSEDIPEDFSLMKVDSFLDEMATVAEECQRVLKPGGMCALLIGDTRKNKRVVPMGFQTIEKFLQAGFSLKDLIIKRQHNCRTTGFWYNSSVKYNFLLLAQEYLPIFIKLDLRKPSAVTLNDAGISFRLAKLAKPPVPDTVQCKTTWVLKQSDWRNEMEANLLNRYSGSGRIVSLEIKNGSSIGAPDLREDIDLLYIRQMDENMESLDFSESYSAKLEGLFPWISSKIRKDGHLAIGVRDYRVDNSLVSPALRLWKLPLNFFKIREIIVVTHEEEDLVRDTEELAITHEYLLIYQKP